MKIIPRYILRHFAPIFLLSLCGFTGLYLIIDFFEKIDDMMEKHLAVTKILLYFVYKTPFIAAQGIPMATLLASLIALSLLKRNRELIAMDAAGIRAFTYIAPIVAAAALISIVHFGAGETIARTLNQRAQTIWLQEVKQPKGAVSWSHENVWYYGQDLIYQVRLYDKRTQSLEKVSLFFLDPHFVLLKRLDAKRVTWADNHWTAEDGIILTFNGTKTQEEWFSRIPLGVTETPADFAELEALPEELGWLDLYRYTNKIEREGYNAIPFQVELQLRVAFPFTSLILAILGVTIALRQGLYGGIALGVGIALVVAFGYLTVLQVGSALGTAGVLPPLVGVWAANVLFAALAGYFWIVDV